MKSLKYIVLTSVLATGLGTLLVMNSFAATPDYIKLLKDDIENGGCYALTLSGSAVRTNKLDGKGPTRTYSFQAKGDLNANKSLNSKLNVRFTDRSNGKLDTQTVWFGSRNGLPVGGVILHSFGDAQIDFERLRLKKMPPGWVLSAESHEGEWNATSYSMVINKKGC